MNELIRDIKENTHIKVGNEEYIIKTKTWYSLLEDDSALYLKCELSNGKVLVIIPDDELMYIGSIIDNMEYNKISDNTIEYKNEVFNKTGDGHQYITEIEFGDENQVEGKCTFEDYESENHIISLGVLTDKNNIRADVYATIIELNDIAII